MEKPELDFDTLIKVFGSPQRAADALGVSRGILYRWRSVGVPPQWQAYAREVGIEKVMRGYEN